MDDNTIRPQLACDLEEEKLKFPLAIMPKIDGVRALNLAGRVTGRSKKEFKNKFVGERYSGEHTLGFDGELAVGDWTAPRLCSDTTGFVNRKTAKPGKPTEREDFVWHIFDLLDPATIHLPYIERLEAAARRVGALADPKFAIVPHKIVHSVEELLASEQEWLDMGFEGLIARDPQGMHKSGRATVRAGTYLRLKRFVDFEGIVENLIEAMENTNEAKTNELGRTERSTHQENMVPKGMIGMIQMRALQDVVHNGEALIVEGQLVDVGPGNMDHDQRKEEWRKFVAGEPCILKQIGKAKFFPKGQKDKPRFPTFIGIRAEEDMSE